MIITDVCFIITRLIRKSDWTTPKIEEQKKAIAMQILLFKFTMEFSTIYVLVGVSHQFFFFFKLIINPVLL